MPIWIMYCEDTSLPKQRDFLEEITKLQKILDIGLKQSRLHKKERLDREKAKSESETMQDELEPIDD